VQLIRFDEIPRSTASRDDFVGTQEVRRVLSGVVTGTPAIVADLGVLPPGFEHRMHKHPEGDQVLLVRRGRVLLYTEDDEITVGPDELIVLPRDEFHGLRNLDDEAEILNVFAGVGETADAGYVPHPSIVGD
jgi:quercetin dioxygenase-like cupin family protein